VTPTKQLPEYQRVGIEQTPLTPREKAVVGYYTEEGSRAINLALRAGKTPEDVHGWKIVESLDSATMSGTLTKDTVLYRGLHGDNPISKLNVGDEFVDRGYVSTTSAKNIADRFVNVFKSPDTEHKRDGDFVQVRLPKGAHVLATNDLNHLGEDEYLLPRGTRFRVAHKSADAFVLDVVR